MERNEENGCAVKDIWKSGFSLSCPLKDASSSFAIFCLILSLGLLDIFFV